MMPKPRCSEFRSVLLNYSEFGAKLRISESLKTLRSAEQRVINGLIKLVVSGSWGNYAGIEEKVQVRGEKLQVSGDS